MSANALVEPYKEQYLNVYEKGALIGMCIDIIIREKSNGERGILDMMHQLSNEYGVTKAFDDKELFAKITALTYPEVGAFLSKYVAGPTPIPYETYFEKVGVTQTIEKEPAAIFVKGRTAYFKINQQTKEIFVNPNVELIDFYQNLGLKGGDILVAINDKPYSLDSIYEMISESQNWKDNDPITMIIKRDGKEQTIKGTVKLNYEEKEVLKATDVSKSALRNAWLKG
jgi:predicted metalloprotease with PDZ domain